MTRDPRYDRVGRRMPDRTVPASAVRASQRRKYSRGPLQSTKALTMKLTALAVVATLVIGGLIATEMAAGNDPALGPKAVARAKTPSAQPSSNDSSTSSGTGSGTDSYGQGYGDDGYSYGSGSNGYSSGSSGYSYSPPPVTSSTS